ncbi:MAG: N-acetyl-D-Glu racemase DgcA [Stappiaceae bacterium]
MTVDLDVVSQSWPIEGTFSISRGSRTEAVVVVVTLSEAGNDGQGECVPYARYGESIDSVCDQILSIKDEIQAGVSRGELRRLMAPGAARNAIDCALWDMEAKKAGSTAAALAGLPPLHPVTTAYTLSVGTPEAMKEMATKSASRPLLKVKLAGDGDDERLKAVREGAPDSVLIIDANEAWSADNFEQNLNTAEKVGVALIEQPLPAGEDDLLRDIKTDCLICADESLHSLDDLAPLYDRYQAVNIKLDKAGGLTEALDMARQAKDLGYKIMTGCMVGTSLGMAPAMLVAQFADFVDLDGPLLLAKDRAFGIQFNGSLMMPPQPALWG